MKRILLAITGASGSIYAERLLEVLVEKVERVYVLATDTGKKVAEHELTNSKAQLKLVDVLNGKIPEQYRQVIRLCQNTDLFAPVASGTSAPDAMIVVPCSMGTLARVSHGISGNLLERAADVAIKEKVPLVIVPRESPLSTIHLRHLLSLSELGVHIIPAMPGFYQKPQSLDDLVNFVTGKILDSLKIEHSFYQPWNSRMR